MKAMILAAGRGERMRPLTDSCPKPLLTVADKPLLVYHLEKLVAMGITDVVINHAWLGDKIEQYIGDGSQWGATVQYSPEPAGGLETAGGILQALPLLGEQPFMVVNGDIWTDHDFAQLPQALGSNLAHLVMVNNPTHNPKGDFCLAANGLLQDGGDLCHTFSGIGVYQPQLFANLKPGKTPLAPLLRHYMKQGQISGEIYTGQWTDVGTPERLAQLQQSLTQQE